MAGLGLVTGLLALAAAFAVGLVFVRRPHGLIAVNSRAAAAVNLRAAVLLNLRAAVSAKHLLKVAIVWLVLLKAYSLGSDNRAAVLRPEWAVGTEASVLTVYRHPTNDHRVAVIGWRDGREWRISWFDADRLTEGGPYEPGAGPFLWSGDRVVLKEDGRVSKIEPLAAR